MRPKIKLISKTRKYATIKVELDTYNMLIREEERRIEADNYEKWFRANHKKVEWQDEYSSWHTGWKDKDGKMVGDGVIPLFLR